MQSRAERGGDGRQVHVHPCCGPEDRGEDLRRFGNVVRGVGVENVFGCVETGPGAGPLLRSGVFGTAEEVEGEVVQVGAGLVDYG